ncbi:MAG: type I 3-dehydroquinate dehydratase, partial [Planctomycetes bacterium]|nr:type I 3-dehydroquinate dehydratase [Planctomycetota bacterium]
MHRYKTKTLLIVPLTQTNPASMRNAIHTAVASGADAVELRLDYLTDASDAALHVLLKDPPCPVVLTCRSAAEGGLGSRGDTERAELLTRAATMAGQWVDFELASLDSAGPLLDVLAPAGEPSEADTRPRLILS